MWFRKKKVVTEPTPNGQNHTLTNALTAVKNSDTQANREQMLQTLSSCELLFAVVLLDKGDTVDSMSLDSNVGVVQRSWNDEPCFFAYTDSSFCAEKHDAYIGFPGDRIAGFIKQFNDRACLVINPTGPATAVVSMVELEHIAAP
jgi:hypothetical protein